MSRISKTADMPDASEPPFAIDIDVARRFAKLTVVGMWTRATLDNYVDQLTRAFDETAALGATSREFRILVDLRRHGIQKRDVAAEIEVRLAQGAAQASRHAVLVSNSVLHAMQAKRAGSLIQAKVFLEEDDALDWLMA